MSLNTETIYKKLGDSLYLSALKGIKLFSDSNYYDSNLNFASNKNSIKLIENGEVATPSISLVETSSGYSFSVLNQDSSNILYSSEYMYGPDMQYGEYQKFVIPNSLKTTDDDNGSWDVTRRQSIQKTNGDILPASGRGYVGLGSFKLDGLSINGNGSRVAIVSEISGAINDNATQRVGIYETNGSGGWYRVGQEIDRNIQRKDEFAGLFNFLSNNVSLNNNGNIVAIGTDHDDLNELRNCGAVRAYIQSGNTWSQLGQTISGIFANDWLGTSVSLNDAGNRLICSQPSRRIADEYGTIIPPQAAIYEISGNQWRQLGQTVTGGAFSAGSLFVDMNSVGNKIIVSCPLTSLYNYEYLGDLDSIENAGMGIADGITPRFYFANGYAKAYEYKGSRWVDLGETFYGQDTDFCGASTSINSSGDIIAISYPGSSLQAVTGVLEYVGAVKVLKYNQFQSGWEQLGKTIYGEAAGAFMGYGGISLNSEGNVLSIGGLNNNSGQNPFAIFKYQNQEWQRLGYDISGAVINNETSIRSIISASGNTVCVSDANISGVKVFNLSSSNLLAQFNSINSQSYGALDFGAYIYPNNYYGFCSGAVDGLLCVKTGIGSGERIVFISDHDVVSGKTYSASYGEGTYSGVTSYNKQNAIPSGMRISFGSGLAITGFNDYLKQSINLTGTSFYRLYGNKYGNVNSGNVWNGLIPSGTPYSISILSTGGYYNSHTDLVVYNTGISYLYSNKFASGGFASGGIPSSITGELSFIIDNLFLTEYSGYAYGLAASEDSSMGLAFLKANKDIESQKYLLKNLTSTSVETGFVSF
jgi:hypothetical protein